MYQAGLAADPLNELPEAIRLVVWDLDETFWKGTLTEGDHVPDRA